MTRSESQRFLRIWGAGTALTLGCYAVGLAVARGGGGGGGGFIGFVMDVGGAAALQTWPFQLLVALFLAGQIGWVVVTASDRLLRAVTALFAPSMASAAAVAAGAAPPGGLASSDLAPIGIALGCAGLLLAGHTLGHEVDRS